MEMQQLIQSIGVATNEQRAQQEHAQERAQQEQRLSKVALRRRTVEQALNGVDCRLEEEEGTNGQPASLLLELSCLFAELAHLDDESRSNAALPSSHWASNLRRASKACLHYERPVHSLADVRAIKFVGNAIAEFCREYFKLRHPHLLPQHSDTGVRHPGSTHDALRFQGCNRPSKHASSARSDDAAGSSRSNNYASGSKAYVPAYGTGNFAILVTLHRLELQGLPEVTKARLQQEAEASGIARHGILPEGNVASTSTAQNIRGKQQFHHSGWSGFAQRLKKTARGYNEPLVHTRSNPMLVRLSESGRALAQTLHSYAEWKMDCNCRLVTPVKPVTSGEGSTSDPCTTRKRKNASADANNSNFQRFSASVSETDPPVGNAHISRSGSHLQGVGANGERDLYNEELDKKGRNKGDEDASAVAAPAHSVWKDRADDETDTSLFTKRRPAEKRHCAPWMDKPLRMPPLDEHETFSDRYTVVLLLDNTERMGLHEQATQNCCNDHSWKRDRETLISRLNQSGVHAEAANLKKGDAMWVARGIENNEHCDEVEFALDVVVERKRVDDLVTSIHNGRWQMQKKHLREGLLQRPVLLLEGNPFDSNSFRNKANADSNGKAVRTAIASAEQLDGLHVLRSDSHQRTLHLLRRMTECIQEHLESRLPVSEIHSTPKLSQAQGEYLRAEHEAESVKQCFGKLLCSLVSVGPRQAEAIIDKYPTPFSLYSAYMALEPNRRPMMLKSIMLSGEARSVGQKVSEVIYKSFFAPSTGNHAG